MCFLFHGKDDMRRAREYGEMECLPFQTFGDVLSDSLQRRSNILMNPINAFFNKTEEIFTPLKQVYSLIESNLLMTELKTSLESKVGQRDVGCK
jgi:hypothetical protein